MRVRILTAGHAAIWRPAKPRAGAGKRPDAARPIPRRQLSVCLGGTRAVTEPSATPDRPSSARLAARQRRRLTSPRDSVCCCGPLVGSYERNKRTQHGTRRILD
jgi:hypothetical protein